MTRLVLLAALIASSPVAAAAQIVAPRETAQIAFGPVSLYPSVQVREMGQDENVFNEGENPKEDFTLTLSSRVLTVVRLASNELMFSTGTDYVWFNRFASERSGNTNYAVRFNLSASRFKPFVGAERMRTRERPSTEIDTRARRLDRAAIAGAGFSVTERTTVSVQARWEESGFDEGEQFHDVELAQPLNYTALTYTAGLRYAVTPFTTIAINGNYREDTFGESNLRDSRSYSLTPSVEFSPEAAIRGTFRAGYEVFRPEDPALAEHRGVVMEGALNWAFTPRTLFDVTVGRNVNYSYLDTEPLYLQTGARLTVSQRLFGPLGLQGSAERQHLSYRWRPGVPPTPDSQDRIDTADTLGVALAINLGRGFTVLVGAEKTRRHSSSDERQNYDRTRLLSTVTVGR
jgi:hypothetical protein